MKKFIHFVAAALTLGITARAADGDQFIVDNLKYQVLSEEGKTVSLIGHADELTGELNLSEIVEHETSRYLLTEIGNDALYGCSSLASVTIPNSVTAIGKNAFWVCSSLTSVTIPNSVTTIGDYAFRGCRSLPSVAIPNSVTAIGAGAFDGCRSFTSVTIPGSVTKIGYAVFGGCNKLAEILVEEENSDYTSFEGVLFSKDKATIVAYPAGKATDYAIPNSVTAIGDGAFAVCYDLTSVIIPNSVTKIGRIAFYDCSSLTSVTIPNSVTAIGEYAFDSCSGLTSITIPGSVTEIGSGAFSSCSALATVNCYAINPPSIDSYVFDGVYTGNVTLHVVKGADAAYKEADVWKEFIIVADLEAQSGIESIEANGSAAAYFNLNGVRVNAGAITPGLYIKRQGGKATKVLVK